MLVVEQLTSSHSHSHHRVNVEFDTELDDLERDQSGVQRDSPASSIDTTKAYSLTLGLVLHGLSDGLALGASLQGDSQAAVAGNLSLVVFLAIFIHKGAHRALRTHRILIQVISSPDSACTHLFAVDPFGSKTRVSKILSGLQRFHTALHRCHISFY